MADITDKHGKIYTNPHPKITIMVSDERRPWTNQILIVQEIILTHAVETWTGTYKYQCFYLLSRSWKYVVLVLFPKKLLTKSKNMFFWDILWNFLSKCRFFDRSSREARPTREFSRDGLGVRDGSEMMVSDVCVKGKFFPSFSLLRSFLTLFPHRWKETPSSPSPQKQSQK